MSRGVIRLQAYGFTVLSQGAIEILLRAKPLSVLKVQFRITKSDAACFVSACNPNGKPENGNREESEPDTAVKTRPDAVVSMRRKSFGDRLFVCPAIRFRFLALEPLVFCVFFGPAFGLFPLTNRSRQVCGFLCLAFFLRICSTLGRGFLRCAEFPLRFRKSPALLFDLFTLAAFFLRLRSTLGFCLLRGLTFCLGSGLLLRFRFRKSQALLLRLFTRETFSFCFRSILGCCSRRSLAIRFCFFRSLALSFRSCSL